jgi:polyhydroxyalkanoate synthesis regulator phasin
MLDAIHKMFLAGVGLAAMTKDKIDEHVKELELAEDVLKKSKQAKKDLEKQVEKQVQQTLQTLQIASKEDVEKLEARIEKLEADKTK